MSMRIPEVGHQLETRDGQIFIVDQITFGAEEIVIRLRDRRAVILQSLVSVETLERLWDIAMRTNRTEIENQMNLWHETDVTEPG